MTENTRIDLLASYDTNAQVAAIEDMIAQDASPQLVLRLMCLASIVNGGIKTKTLENLKREFLQVSRIESRRKCVLISQRLTATNTYLCS
jgi:hypothetical protein